MQQRGQPKRDLRKVTGLGRGLAGLGLASRRGTFCGIEGTCFLCQHKTYLCYQCDIFLTFSWYPLGLGLPDGASGKEPACQCRRCKRRGFNPWVGKIPWRRAWQPLQCSNLENPLDKGTWQATVHGVTESDMTEATQHGIQHIPQDQRRILPTVGTRLRSCNA